jgi:dTDP-4-amino-4,6-dideoxygalactose transaminase
MDRWVEQAITPRTRRWWSCIYGQPAQMDWLNALARRRGIAVIADAAQPLRVPEERHRGGGR